MKPSGYRFVRGGEMYLPYNFQQQIPGGIVEKRKAKKPRLKANPHGDVQGTPGQKKAPGYEVGWL